MAGSDLRSFFGQLSPLGDRGNEPNVFAVLGTLFFSDDCFSAMKPTRAVSFGQSIVRSYAPKYPRLRPGTSERPAFHHPDPLVNNPKATVTTLEENLTFIHRPPPTAPSPYSLTAAPASPLLCPRTPTPEGALPPLSRPSSVTPTPTERLSDADFVKMRKLRDSDPEKYTRSVLAEMFDVPSSFVSFGAGLKRNKWKEITKARDQTHTLQRETWSERHQVVKAIQKKRRELW